MGRGLKLLGVTPSDMVLRAITYLLLVLVTLQSSVALADLHAAHQSGAEHLSFEGHQHSVDGAHQISASDSSDHHGLDCHHCCHCHGHLSPAVPMNLPVVTLIKNTSPVPVHSDTAVTDTFESFLRPPIV